MCRVCIAKKLLENVRRNERHEINSVLSSKRTKCWRNITHMKSRETDSEHDLDYNSFFFAVSWQYIIIITRRVVKKTKIDHSNAWYVVACF